jgi:hypothetical protein
VIGSLREGLRWYFVNLGGESFLVCRGYNGLWEYGDVEAAFEAFGTCLIRYAVIQELTWTRVSLGMGF